MNSKGETSLSSIRLSMILIKIQNGESLDPVFSESSAEEMKEIRNFLESEIIYLSRLRDEKTISLSEIKSNFEPAPNYYYKQDCREPLESCLNETCLASNPVCFSRKMRMHIDVLTKILTPYLEKQ